MRDKQDFHHLIPSASQGSRIRRPHKFCSSVGYFLISECHSLPYDALTAHVAIVITTMQLLFLPDISHGRNKTLERFA